MAAKIQANYEKFMEEMKGFQMDGADLENMGDMGDMAGSLEGLLKGLTESLGVEGVLIHLFRKKARTSRTCLKELATGATSRPSLANF